MKKFDLFAVIAVCLYVHARADDVTNEANDGLGDFDIRNTGEMFADDFTATDTSMKKELQDDLETRQFGNWQKPARPCKKRTYYSRSFRGVYYARPVKNTVCRPKTAVCNIRPLGKCQTRVVSFLAQGRCRRGTPHGRQTIWFFAQRRECMCVPVKQCPPVCKIFCPCGNVMVEGCPICKCKPCPTCPPLCKNRCPCGRIYDKNGCPTCHCRKCGSHGN